MSFHTAAIYSSHLICSSISSSTKSHPLFLSQMEMRKAENVKNNINDPLALSLSVEPVHTTPTYMNPFGQLQPNEALISPQISSPQVPFHVSLSPPPPPSTFEPPLASTNDSIDSSSSRRVRRRVEKSEIIPPPFPWATDRRARVYTLSHLLQNQIFTITGEVQCKRCERKFEMGFDLKKNFSEVSSFIAKHECTMHDRAPTIWLNPKLPTCKHCGQENSVKPVMAEKKRSVNWLFLLLGQMLGCCTLEQLRYFCKHTKNHRTGAKDRVLYRAYVELCKQLCPEWHFY